MHAEIENVKHQVLRIYSAQRDYLRSKPRLYLEELLHRAQEDLTSPIYSTRTAAEINFAAVTILLGNESPKEGSKR